MTTQSKNKKTQLKADMMLLLVTMCWGISYFLMDLSLEEMDPFTLNAWRFLGAFGIAAAISFPRLRTVNRATMKYALFVGVALTVVYIGCTFGVKYTSQSNAGFLCAMTVVFTPLFAWLFKRVLPGRKLAAVVCMCLVGIALMTLDDRLHMALGDVLCLMCAVAYAADLLITETAVGREDVDAYQLGVFQLLFTGIFMLILALIFEEPGMPKTGTGWFAVAFLAVFCTGVAFIVQSVAQQYTSSTHVGVIFCLEPVFAGIVAFFLAGEVLLPRAYAGAGLMLAGLLLMELDLGKLPFFRSKGRKSLPESDGEQEENRGEQIS